VAPFQLFVVALCAWLHREQTDLIAFLREENRVLKSRLGGRRLRFDDGERRRLGELGHRLGRRLLTRVSTVVTPDTILRWHRELVARKWTYRGSRASRYGLQAHLRTLIVRMATENPTWGYTRIQGALKNVGHRVGRSTIARVLRADGIPPGRAAHDTMADVCTSALAGTRCCRLLHNRGVDHARTRDVLHRISDRIAVQACTDPWLDAIS